MPQYFRRLRHLALPLGSGLLVLGIFYVAAAFVRPDLTRQPPPPGAAELAAVTQLRDTRIKSAQAPVLAQVVDYTAGPSAKWWPRHESNELAELVQAGQLPPVSERTGPEPLVLQGVDGIGRFGGTWFRAANSVSDVGIISGIMSGATLVRWSPLGQPIVPHLAKGWTVSADAREYTFALRRGVRWSDGHPFTADDILFWWEKDVLFFSGYPRWMQVAGKPGRVEKIDDYTVKFIFPEPNGLFLTQLAGAHTLALPKHYLAAYHPDTGDRELIARTMKELSLASPIAVYLRVKTLFNPEHPRLWPWIYRSHQTSSPYVFVRNPYYWAVDPAGNQLPYLDRVLFTVKSTSMIGAAAAAGELSMQERHLRFEDYTLLMNGRAGGNYEVYHWYPTTRSIFTVFPNLNRRIDPRRPETRLKHALLNEVDFRRALSLAVNREEIIRAEYANTVEPAQLDPGPESVFHNPRLFHSYTAHDPATAGRLLDGLGLVRRDGEGFRTFRDGSRMTFFLDSCEVTGSGPAQFLIDDWAVVGVRVILRERARSLFYVENSTYEHDFTIWNGESEFFPLLEPRNFVPISVESFYAPGFGIWYQDGGMHDAPLARAARSIKPPDSHPLRRAMQVLEQARRAVGEEAQAKIFQEALELAADNVWSISVSTPPPALVVVKNGLHNVPRQALAGIRVSSPALAGIETFYWDHPTDSPGAIAQVKDALVHITPDPDLHRAVAHEPASFASSGGGRALTWLLRTLIWGGLALWLGLVALRHPFIARRLLIMGPTLLVIAVVAFVVIQLPPGDFLTSRIADLELSGDFGAVQAVRDLKTMFHVDDPAPLKFARWLGLLWFKTYDPADLGLLQGNLGRSMEDGQLVNNLVGDRILLTFLISFCTILFTWAIAIPVGIFSAVRQYSLADYAVTLVAFVGMSVPGFLLALVLIYASQQWFGWQITGLFSAEYAAQPEWSTGKLLDLLRHIWVPVVVLGLSSTAGMIRVMRANLLDELRKPYVTTARAKGLRPLRLLLKYPVRLALNPFISGLGGIFPQLVSGGAVVSIVLSLPTIGPLMLSALMNQDMYLAGSMLMVLSLLGVMGTLVSDLLLLVLDPRIRFEGGSR